MNGCSSDSSRLPGDQQGRLVCRNLIRTSQVMALLYYTKPPTTNTPRHLSVSASSRWECAYTERTVEEFREIREHIRAEIIRSFKEASVTQGGEDKTTHHLPPSLSDVYAHTPPCAPRGACTYRGGTLTQDKMSKQGRNIKAEKKRDQSGKRRRNFSREEALKMKPGRKLRGCLAVTPAIERGLLVYPQNTRAIKLRFLKSLL